MYIKYSIVIVFICIVYAIDVCNGVYNTNCSSNYNVSYVNEWPEIKYEFGQLSAVSLDNDGNVYVFHRGNHIWDYSTFSQNNTYLKINDGPIAVDTVVILNSTTGNYLRSWGHELFYMPHGLTVDFENNIWLTDVALHQVFKYDSYGKHFFTLGEKFISGKDNQHFCKPTSVAVLKNGDFFIADGYCNSRIMKFSNNGIFLLKWGVNNNPVEKQPPYNFNIPHALTIIEDLNEICVADRENGRILCFNYLTGIFKSEYKFYDTIGLRLFSISYASIYGGKFYVVNGPPLNPLYNVSVSGFIINKQTKTIESNFEPINYNFANPHDIIVNKNGTEIYVVELYPFIIHKFNLFFKNGCKEEVIKEKTDTEPVFRNNHIYLTTILISLLIITILLIITYKLYFKGKKNYRNLNIQGRSNTNENDVLTQLV